jgi:hypothetical protein
MFGLGEAYDADDSEEQNQIGARNARLCRAFLQGTGQGLDVEGEHAPAEWKSWLKAYAIDPKNEKLLEGVPSTLSLVGAYEWMKEYLKE